MALAVQIQLVLVLAIILLVTAASVTAISGSLWDVKSFLNPTQASMTAEALRASLKDGWAPRDWKTRSRTRRASFDEESLKIKEELGIFEDPDESDTEESADTKPGHNVQNRVQKPAVQMPAVQPAKPFSAASDKPIEARAAPVQNDPLSVMLKTPELAGMGQMLQASRLRKNLTDCQQSWTILAPKTSVFETAQGSSNTPRSPMSVIDDDATLEEIFELHILPGIWSVQSLTDLATDGDSVRSMSSELLSMNLAGGNRTLSVEAPERGSVASIDLTRKDIETDKQSCNGVVHMLDNLLVPGSVLPTAKEALLG